MADLAGMPALRKVLLFGGTGQLGDRIRHRWPQVAIVAPSSSAVDVRDASAVASALAQTRPDAVVNCTAYNDVPGAQDDPAAAFALNALAVGGMARASATAGVPFLTVSTDYVFDGTAGRAYTENDRPHPLSAYGASKLAGEVLTFVYCEQAYVVRTCGVYGTRVSSSKGYTFVDRIIARARNGEALRVVDDQIVSPTYAGDLADALYALLERMPEPGIYHAVNEGAVSWYDVAREALRQAGVQHEIEAVATAEFPSPVRRPAYSALENAKLHALGVRLPSWQDGIATYLRDKNEPAPA